MSVKDRMDAPAAEAWRPGEPQDYPDHPNPLVGEIVEVSEGDGDYGSYPILYIKDEVGNEWRWHVYGSVAQNRIIALRPEVGDEIGVKFLGTEPSKVKGYAPYKNWKIVIDKKGKAAAGPNWEAMKPEDGPEGEDDF